MKHLFTLILIIMTTTTTQAQPWLDTTEYPFQHKYIELEAGKMHYVDEGSGETILFVHGTPTWSFLYRNYIKEFSKTHRCIAIDHIGFGLSEKPSEFPGTPQAHSKNLVEFIKRLNLQDITLVVHDFGGPIGLSAAIEEPSRVKNIVLFNSWLWETALNPEAKKAGKVINSRLGKFLYLRMNFSPKVLLKKGFYDKKKLSKNMHKQYINPFPDKASRLSLLNIAKSLVGASDWYQRQWEQLHNIESKNWLILWGTEDEFFTTKDLKRWKSRLPHAEVRTFVCGHFVQEECSSSAIQDVQTFLYNLNYQ